MLMVQSMSDKGMKARFNFRVELKDQVQFIGVEYCVECNGWIRALHRIRETMEENNRSKFESLRRNIDKFVFLYRRKQGQEIKDLCKEDYEEFFGNFNAQEAQVGTFIDICKKAQNRLEIVKKYILYRLLMLCKLIGHFSLTYSNFTSRIITRNLPGL